MTKCKVCSTEYEAGSRCAPCKANRWRMRDKAKKGIEPSSVFRAIKYKKQAAALLKSGYMPGKRKSRSG